LLVTEARTALNAEASEETIALRARSDRDAFAELYVQQRDRVFRFLRARCATDDDALEVTAQTFERALVAMPRYSTQRGGVTAWLLRIARNAAVDQERRRRPIVAVSGAPGSESTEPSPEEVALGVEERRALRQAMRRLPAVQRDALALRFGARLTAREISLVIGKSEDATQKLISRAIARLREDLEP
jgi:RNA polymerase sigma factor (sigma-70 family)